MSFRASLVNFLEDADTKRLLVFLDGKDLGVVRANAQFEHAAPAS
jgi:hypothetical protein